MNIADVGCDLLQAGATIVLGLWLIYCWLRPSPNVLAGERMGTCDRSQYVKLKHLLQVICLSRSQLKSTRSTKSTLSSFGQARSRLKPRKPRR